MESWQAFAVALEREERERWDGLPAAGALYGTAGFRDRSAHGLHGSETNG